MSPLGSVVTPGSASFSSPKTASKHALCPEWLRRCCKSHHAGAGGSRMILMSGIRSAEVAASTTAARRVTKGCSGKRPAATASQIIAEMRGLAAMSAPRCAGLAMSRALSCTQCPTGLRRVWLAPSCFP